GRPLQRVQLERGGRRDVQRGRTAGGDQHDVRHSVAEAAQYSPGALRENRRAAHLLIMKNRWMFALGVLAAAMPLSGAPQDKPQLPKSQMPDLGRPTRPNDEQPLFNFDEYFLGKWTFEWDVPEGILGPSGTIKGAVTYKRIDGPFFQDDTTASGPG